MSGGSSVSLHFLDHSVPIWDETVLMLLALGALLRLVSMHPSKVPISLMANSWISLNTHLTSTPWMDALVNNDGVLVYSLVTLVVAERPAPCHSSLWELFCLAHVAKLSLVS